MTPKELAEKRAVLAKRIQEMAQKCHDENRDFTAEEQQNWTAINVDYDVMTRRLELLQRTEQIEAHQTAVANNPAGRIGREDIDPENARHARPSDGRRRRVRYGLNDLSIPAETRDLALRSWMGTQVGADIPEEWDEAAAECGIRPEQTWLRLQLYDTPTFRAMPRWENGAPRLDMRAQSVGVAGKGPELVPEGFVPRLEKALLQFGGMMQTSEVMRTDAGNDLPWPTVDDTSNKGVLLPENQTVAEQDVAFAALTMQAFKYSSKLVKVSIELIQDTAISISETLGDLLGERLGRIVQEHFTTGTGTAQPRGIEVAAPIGLTTAPTGTYDEDDLIDLLHSVDQAYRTGARFMMHDTIVAVTRKFKDANGQFIWQPGLQLGQPDRVIGHGLSINQEMDSAVTIGNDIVIFGDLTKYKVRVVREIRLRRLVERFADTDQEGFVAFIRVDGDLLDAGTGPVKKMRVG